MTTYKGIKGFKVQSFSADPVPSVAGYTAGGHMSNARSLLGGYGTQTASMATGGSPRPSHGTKTEEYNGSSWSDGGAYPTNTQSLGACGTQTAALAFGGITPPVTTATTESRLWLGF